MEVKAHQPLGRQILPQILAILNWWMTASGTHLLITHHDRPTWPHNTTTPQHIVVESFALRGCLEAVFSLIRLHYNTIRAEAPANQTALFFVRHASQPRWPHLSTSITVVQPLLLYKHSLHEHIILSVFVSKSVHNLDSSNNLKCALQMLDSSRILSSAGGSHYLQMGRSGRRLDRLLALANKLDVTQHEDLPRTTFPDTANFEAAPEDLTKIQNALTRSRSVQNQRKSSLIRGKPSTSLTSTAEEATAALESLIEDGCSAAATEQLIQGGGDVNFSQRKSNSFTKRFGKRTGRILEVRSLRRLFSEATLVS